MMHDAFVERTEVDLTEVMETHAEANPLTDVVDSFFIHTFIKNLT